MAQGRDFYDEKEHTITIDVNIEDYEEVNVYICPHCIKKYGLYKETETTEEQIDEVLTALGEVVVDVVKADDKVTIPNIGTVSVKDVPERRGKIMMGERKGEEYVVVAHREPKIKLTKNFKEVLL